MQARVCRSDNGRLLKGDRMLRARTSLSLFLFLVTIACAAQDGNWERLVQLHEDFKALRDAGKKDSAPDFSPTAIESRAAQLGELRSRCRLFPRLVGPSLGK